MTIEQTRKTGISDYMTDDEDLENSTRPAELDQVDLEGKMAISVRGESAAVQPLDSGMAAKGGIDPLDEILAALESAYDRWEAANARSDAACYRALGEIFVGSKLFDDDKSLKLRLINKVKRHPDVEDSNRFDGMKESGASLLLTKLFGLKKHRGAKSNWLKVISAANLVASRGELDRSVEAFEVWINRVGFAGAFALLREPKQAATLEPFMDLKGEETDLPGPIPTDSDFPNGFALAVFRVDETDAEAKPEWLGYVTDTKIIASACRVLKKEQDAEDEEFIADAIAASGDPDLLIPERHRHHFDGRTHYTDEDERVEFNRERQAEAKRIRANPGLKTQEEIAKKGRGKGKLPLDRKGEVVASLSDDNPDDINEEENVEPGTTPPPSLPEAQPPEIPSADPPTYPEIQVDSSGSEESMDEAVEEGVE